MEVAWNVELPLKGQLACLAAQAQGVICGEISQSVKTVQALSCEGFVCLQLHTALCAKGLSLFPTFLCPLAPRILHFCSFFAENDNLFDSTFFFPPISRSNSLLSFLCRPQQFISIPATISKFAHRK